MLEAIKKCQQVNNKKVIGEVGVVHQNFSSTKGNGILKIAFCYMMLLRRRSYTYRGKEIIHEHNTTGGV